MIANLSLLIAIGMMVNTVLIIIMFVLDKEFEHSKYARFFHLLAYRCLIITIFISMIACGLLALMALHVIGRSVLDLLKELFT